MAIAKKKTAAAKPAAAKEAKKEAKPAQKKDKVGRVTHFFDKIGVAVINVEKPIKVGDKISIEGVTTNFEQKIDSMQVDMKPIKEAKKGDDIGMKVKDKVRENDIVYKL